jgi:hypothetical protein
MRRTACTHAVVDCLNSYELIRKYRCTACKAVMMCECDREFGTRFLSHQLDSGTELKSQKRLRVTLGFRPNICRECRGLPAEPAPHDEGYGSTSKIKRYYWRELWFKTWRREADWNDAHPDASDTERAAARDRIEGEVLQSIKDLHATSPKYVFNEPSQAEVLQCYRVEVTNLKAPYVIVPLKGAVIATPDGAVSPEAFATTHFEKMGWSVMLLESQPLHVLFGVMMWSLIQDSRDPLVKLVGFAEKTAVDAGLKPGLVHSFLPEDFGSEGYAERRKRAIDKHFREIDRHGDDLLWLFDYWRTCSEDFRQYLWAHRSKDVDRARRLVELLPPQVLLTILRYLVSDYWGHYLGWPDLFLYRDQDFEFVEVKSSSDKLNAKQKRWIADNSKFLQLPFRLVKLHRATARR